MAKTTFVSIPTSLYCSLTVTLSNDERSRRVDHNLKYSWVAHALCICRNIQMLKLLFSSSWLEPFHWRRTLDCGSRSCMSVHDMHPTVHAPSEALLCHHWLDHRMRYDSGSNQWCALPVNSATTRDDLSWFAWIRCLANSEELRGEEQQDHSQNSHCDRSSPA